jgi:hypothetical protein
LGEFAGKAGDSPHWLILCNHAYLGYEAPKQRIFSLLRALQSRSIPAEVYKFGPRDHLGPNHQTKAQKMHRLFHRYRLTHWWARLIRPRDFLIPFQALALQKKYRNRALVILSSYPSLGNLILGRLLHILLPKSRLIFDYRDYCAGLDQPGLLATIFRRVIFQLRKGCSLELTVSHGHRKKMGRAHGVPFLLLRNGYPQSFGKQPRAVARRVFSRPCRVAYFGTIEEPRRSLRPLFSALSRTPDACNLQLDLWGSLDAYSLSLVRTLNVSHAVNWRGECAHADVPDKMRDYDAFLHLLWADVSCAGFISSKIYEYAFWKKPVLMIGPSKDVEAVRLALRLGGVHLGETVLEIEQSLADLPGLLLQADRNRRIPAKLFERESMWGRLIGKA